MTRPMSGGWNLLGVWSLYLREIKRFSKIYIQTLFAPVITALLFLAIFSLAFEGQGRSIRDIPFSSFLTPGLTLMALMTSCFSNASFSITFEKIIQTIVDTLMPPISPVEITLGYVLASSTRGLLVAILVALSIYIFVPFYIYSWKFVLFHAVGAALLMSLLGIITGVLAEKIDHVASMNNFVILPLTFLSGTFFSTQHLPEVFQLLVLFNPIFYVIDGFRFGFFGYADGSIIIGVILIATLDVILWLTCVHLFRAGYKLKS